MLDLVSTELEKNVLKEANISIENIYSLDNSLEKKLSLCVGPIDKIVGETKLIDELKKYHSFRIWYSSINSEELNTYYYLINSIYNNVENSIIYAINITDYNKDILSISYCKPQEVSNFLKYQKQLKDTKIKEISNNWEQLKKENADLRLIENNKLISMPYSKLETEILKKLSKYEEISEIEFIGNLLVHRIFSIDNQIILSKVIDKLIKNNQIKILRIEKIKNFFGKEINVNILSIKK